jgi:hypothetical protein
MVQLDNKVSVFFIEYFIFMHSNKESYHSQTSLLGWIAQQIHPADFEMLQNPHNIC